MGNILFFIFFLLFMALVVLELNCATLGFQGL